MKSDDDHDDTGTAAPIGGEDAPYQLETMVLPRADAQGKQQLSALLDTHVMSRDAIRNLQQNEPAPEPEDSPPTVSEMLVPEHIRRRAVLATAPVQENVSGPVTLKDPDGLDLMLALGVGSMDADTNHHTLADTLLIWMVEAIGDGRDRVGVDSFCDILLRFAEDVAERGMAGLAAICLRYRRRLQRLDATQREAPDLALTLLEWPMLVSAYLADPSDRHVVRALVDHVDAADDGEDAEFEGMTRLAGQLESEAQRQAGAGDALPESLIRQAGDAVFHAGRIHVFVDSALRRAEQHRAAVQAGKDATAQARSFDAVERRLGDLRQTVADLQSLTREHHGALAARATRPAGEAFVALRQALNAAALERRGALRLNIEGESVPVDGEAAEALGGPLAEVGWWLARHGVAAEPRAVGAAQNEARVRFARRGQAVVIDITMGAGFLEALAEVTTFPESETWSEEIERELLRMAVMGQTPDSELAGFASRFDALHQAAAGLGGACRLRYASGEGVLLQVRVPGWLTFTTGRLIPAGGGVLTVRQTGIDRLDEIGRDEVQRTAGGVQYVEMKGERIAALWLLDLLGLPQGTETLDHFAVSAMLTRAGGTQVVVLAAGVSEPLGFSVRGVGERLPKVPGVVGGTVLVGGEVSPLIDLPTVVQAHLREQQQRRAAGNS